MDIGLYLELGLFVVLLGFSGFFSSSETSLFSLNALTLERMRRERNPRIRLIERLLSEPRRLIVTILIGNEFVNVAASVISAALVIRFMGPDSKWVNLFIMVPLLLLFGEITPKTLAIRHNVAFATVQGPLIELFARLIAPVRWGVRKIAEAIIRGIAGTRRSAANIVTEDLVRSLAEEALGDGVLDRQEARFITKIFNFGDLTAEDVMTPRSDFFALPSQMPLPRMARELHRTRHTKVPVYEDDLDHIVGVLYARDFLGIDLEAQSDVVAAGLLRKTYMVPGSKSAADLFQTFQRRKLSMALVIDEFGGITGLVTLEDLLECIFGDIRSGSEALRERGVKVERLASGDYQVDGIISVSQFNRVLGTDLSDATADTLGGVLLDAFGELPAEGASITVGGVHYLVLTVSDQRIAQVRVRRGGDESAPAPAGAEGAPPEKEI
jgi:putative hemolysin